MKIIDLLNKIANGEEVPKQIKLKGIEPVFQYDNKEFYYYWEDTKTGKGGKATLDLIYNINDEVEIIEDKKIERFDPCLGGIMSFDSVEHIFETYKDKINEIIDEVIKMKEGK